MIVWSDIVLYWAHRLSHQVPFLWRFHKVHHTSERLDWVAAYREHPVDNLYTRLVENVPAMLLGFPLYTIAGFAVFRGLWAIYIHSNCRLIQARSATSWARRGCITGTTRSESAGAATSRTSAR